MVRCFVIVVCFINLLLCSSAEDDSCAHVTQGIGTENPEVLSLLSEHSNSDHLAYVQTKVSKVRDVRNHAFDEPEAEAVVQAFYSPNAWSYTLSSTEGACYPCGPNRWHEIEGAQQCGEEGTQSPIDAPVSNATSHPTINTRNISLESAADACDTSEYVLNEDTVQMSVPAKCSTTYKVTWLGKDFYMTDFHFHSPSEHMWDGSYLPLEVHHVHKAADGQALVVVVMAGVASSPTQVDAGRNAFLSQVFKRIPFPGEDKAHNRFISVKSTELWNPYESFIPDLGEGFFYYEGSYTTPPCTTLTVWIMSPHVVMIAQNTLALFRNLINSNPINKLTTFGNVSGQGHDAMPTWNLAAGSPQWSPELKIGNRPIQPLQGSTDPYRRFYKIVNPEPRIVRAAHNDDEEESE